MKQKLVRVEWLDNNTLHGWQYGEYPAELANCISVGFIKEEDEEKLSLVQTISSYEAHMGVMVIAKGCIKNIKELRIR